jgi:fibronectin-binding autotransporter adhesin
MQRPAIRLEALREPMSRSFLIHEVYMSTTALARILARPSRALLSVMLPLFVSLPVAAQTSTWTGSVDNAWHNSANWTSGVPNASVAAVIAAVANSPTTGGAAATCASLTVSSGAVLTLSTGGPLSASGSSITIDGTVAGVEPLTLTGAGATNLSMGLSGSVAALFVGKSFGGSVFAASSLVVVDDLVVTSGLFNVNFGRTVSVGDDAFFNGGTLGAGSATTSVVDVAGDVVFAGTVAAATTPRIRAGGDYVGATSWAPTAGEIVFDAGPSTISGACSFADLTVNPGVSVTTAVGATVNGVLTVNGGGASLVCGGALDVNGAATVAAGGAWDLGAFTHSVGGNGTFSGAVLGAGVVRFDGATNATWSGASSLPAAEVSKVASTNLAASGSVGTVGDLTVTSGVFVVNTGATVLVGDDAVFNGGSLAAGSASNSIVDAADEVVFAGSIAGVTTPQLRVGGDYVGAASWAPSGGSTVFDGGPSTVFGVCNFAGLTVNAGVAVTTVVGAAVNGVLAVNGGGASLVCGGDFGVTGAATVAAGGTWDLGSFTHSVGGSGTFSGAVTGAGIVRFDGPANATWSGTTALPAVEVAKSSSADLAASGIVGVVGDLTVTSGDFVVNTGATVNVGDDAQFSGGTMAAGSASTSVVDVADDAVFAGTTTLFVGANAPQLRIGGDYVGASSWVPAVGLTVFDAGPSTVSGVCSFADLTVNAGVSVTTTVGAAVNGVLAVSGGGASLVCGGPLDVNSAATVAAGGAWELGTFTHAVGGSGTFNGAVTGAGVVRFDGPANATWSGTTALPAVEVAKSSSADLAASGIVGVVGDLTVTSGDFVVNAGATVNVGDDAQFSGGTMAAGSASTSVVDVADDAVFVGTTTLFVGANVPQLRIGGDYVGASSWAPAGGSTVFDAGPSSTSGVCSFADLTVNAGVSVTTTVGATVNGVLAVNGGGASLVCGGPLDVSGAATVAAGGTWELGTFTHAVGGSGTFNGAVSGAGVVRFDGPANATWSGTAALPEVEIAKVGSTNLAANGAVSIVGDLTVASGVFVVNTGATVNVGDDATFNGGSLAAGSASTSIVDVADDAVFAGTTTLFVGASAPQLRIGGDYVGASSWAPAGGLTVFDAGPSTVSGVCSFADLTVNVGVSVTTTVGAAVNGVLAVNGGGAALVCGGPMDVNGAATVAVGGTWELGTFTHSVGGSGTFNGAVTGAGAVRFDGATNATWSGTSALPAVEIAKVGSTNLAASGSIGVAGNLTVTSGTFVVGLGAIVSVGNDAFFNGGAFFTNSTASIIDIADDAVFAGTTTLFAGALVPQIHIGGDYVADATWAPTSGLIELDGASPSTVAPLVPGATLTFNDVAIRNGTRTLAADATWAAASTTIHAGSALRAGTGATLSWTANAPTVNGTLGADAGGALALGPAINLTVPVGGALSLVGTPTNRARLTRAGAAGYGVTVNGTIEAMNFLVEFGGANGLVVPAGATVAPAPRDLRNGFFDNPFSPAAAQLTLTRNAPFDLRYPVFEKSNGVVASNVRTLSGAAIDVVNFAGTQAGEAFDDDPSSLVTWSPAEQSVVSFFAGVPGVSKATLVWTMTSLIDAEAFLIERSDAGGPFAQVFETAAAGLGPYAFVDDPLVALTTYTYKLYQRLTHGVVTELGTATVTPFTTPPPANILDVGPTAGVTTLQQAVNAALAAGGQITILRVQAGTFAPFTLSSTPPGGLRIFADGPGAFVDTTTGPVTIQNLAAGNPVEIRGLAIGSGASTQPALVVQNCDAPVIVDDCVVATGGAVAAARVSDCPAGVALTRLSASGNPGVRVEQASFAAVTGGTIDELSAANGSYVQTCELGGAAVLNDGSSTFEPCAGALPRLDVDSFVSIGTPLVFTFQGAPLSYWALVGSFGVDYVAFPASVLQMPVLMNIPSAFIQSEQFADGVGSGTYPGLLPPSPALLGLPFSWQAVQLDLSGSYRFSNLATFVPVL